MPVDKIFTLAEARAILPELKIMLNTANLELTEKAETLANAYAINEGCEEEMSKVKVTGVTKGSEEENLSTLRECRLNFQASIESLEKAKRSYIQGLNYWLEEISQTGVILRDIKAGLLDFPADAGNFQYYLCWQANEKDIQYWHMFDDGFTGRKPLAALSEYL